MSEEDRADLITAAEALERVHERNASDDVDFALLEKSGTDQ